MNDWISIADTKPVLSMSGFSASHMVVHLADPFKMVRFIGYAHMLSNGAWYTEEGKRIHVTHWLPIPEMSTL